MTTAAQQAKQAAAAKANGATTPSQVAAAVLAARTSPATTKASTTKASSKATAKASKQAQLAAASQPAPRAASTREQAHPWPAGVAPCKAWANPDAVVARARRVAPTGAVVVVYRAAHPACPPQYAGTGYTAWAPATGAVVRGLQGTQQAYVATMLLAGREASSVTEKVAASVAGGQAGFVALCANVAAQVAASTAPASQPASTPRARKPRASKGTKASKVAAA